MTEEEIRERVKTFKLHQDRLPLNIIDIMMWEATMEIAAQLAELNERVKSWHMNTPK